MCLIPCDVPLSQQENFKKHYNHITKESDHLFLFAADQKMEHLNLLNPEDLFTIASSPHIGAFATHLGLIKRFGKKYPSINYIAKLNGKTNLIPTVHQDPISRALWSIDEVIEIKEEAKLSICGIGYTIYLGSEFEEEMLVEAAQLVYEAHRAGLIAILWIYPRGKAVAHETTAKLLAGATGVAASLGADFVKIKLPHPTQTESSAELVRLAVTSAGNTKVICAGGERQEVHHFLTELYEALTVGKVAGAAIGRNIYEHDFLQAAQITQAVSELIYQHCPLERALEILKK